MRVWVASTVIFLSEVNIDVDGKLRNTHTSLFRIQIQFPSEGFKFHWFLWGKKSKKDLLTFIKFCTPAAKFNNTRLCVTSVCFGKQLEKIKLIPFLGFFNNLSVFNNPSIKPRVLLCHQCLPWC